MIWDGRLCCDSQFLPIADESVHCVVTSPPYWGLRQYEIPNSIWGGECDCEHLWGPEERRGGPGGYPGGNSARLGRSNLEAQRRQDHSLGAWCQSCGAWRGQLGLEPTPDLYVEHVVGVFREVKRVLRSDGIVWLNIGDSYATGGGKVGRHPGGGKQGERWAGRVMKDAGRIRDQKREYRDDSKGRGTPDRSTNSGDAEYHYYGPMTQPNRLPIPGLKPKDLCMIPARVALALQADGWWLRSDCIWAKPNGMPESVQDRPTRSHEYVYLLTKSEEYFYDSVAIAEPTSSADEAIYDNGGNGHHGGRSWAGSCTSTRKFGNNPGVKNKRTVWFIATQPYPEAHYATFPPDLIQPCILAGTSDVGCCSICGTPWERVIQSVEVEGRGRGSGNVERKYRQEHGGNPDHSSHLGFAIPWTPHSLETIAWRLPCSCPLTKPRPCIVLDTFAGSGTTAQVAKKNGRRWLACDMGYQDLQFRRTAQEVMAFT